MSENITIAYKQKLNGLRAINNIYLYFQMVLDLDVLALYIGCYRIYV